MGSGAKNSAPFVPMNEAIANREITLSPAYSNGIYQGQARRYTRLLRTYDKDLMAKWLPDKQRWSIWTRDRKGLAYLVYCCEGVKGEYREMGQKDLVTLAAIDMARKEQGYSILAEIERRNQGVETARDKKMSDDVIAISKERWRSCVGNPVVPCNIEF